MKKITLGLAVALMMLVSIFSTAGQVSAREFEIRGEHRNHVEIEHQNHSRFEDNHNQRRRGRDIRKNNKREDRRIHVFRVFDDHGRNHGRR